MQLITMAAHSWDIYLFIIIIIIIYSYFLERSKSAKMTLNKAREMFPMEVS